MKNLNTSTGSKFYVDFKNVKNIVVKVLFHVDIHSSNEAKKERQVNSGIIFGLLEHQNRFILSLSQRHTHTQQQTTTLTRTPMALKNR